MKNYLQNLIKINGAISVGQFMNEALFHPKFGYYNTQNPFGKNGDFITAPEISQVFGELIAAYLIELWQTNYDSGKINLVEMGAGRGTLMKDFLQIAKKIPHFLKQVKISIVEISPKLQEIQKINLQGFDIGWHDNFTDFYKQNDRQPIFFIANELFDCFAIEQLVKTENGWLHRMVDIDQNGELRFILNLPAATKRLPSNNTSQPINSVFEYSPQATAFMNELSIAIQKNKGIGLVIDYGYIENKFQNTLQAVKNHLYSNILQNVGSVDITALVDFSVLQKIATKNNLQSSVVTQKEFLTTIGIEQRREKLLQEKNETKKYLINSSINRLIDEKQMGELFKELIIW